MNLIAALQQRNASRVSRCLVSSSPIDSSPTRLIDLSTVRDTSRPSGQLRQLRLQSTFALRPAAHTIARRARHRVASAAVHTRQAPSTSSRRMAAPVCRVTNPRASLSDQLQSTRIELSRLVRTALAPLLHANRSEAWWITIGKSSLSGVRQEDRAALLRPTGNPDGQLRQLNRPAIWSESLSEPTASAQCDEHIACRKTRLEAASWSRNQFKTTSPRNPDDAVFP